MVPIMKGN